MKFYVGNTVKNAVLDAKKYVKMNALCKQIDLSRTQLYTILNQPEMELKYIVGIGKAIGVDLTSNLKGFKKEDLDNLVLESEDNFQATGSDMKDELLDIQRKYIASLEENNRLWQRIRELEKEKGV